MSGSVIVAGARTPIGRLLGGLKTLSAAELGGVAIKGALDKAGVSPDQVDYLIMGQVILAGAGQNPARQVALKAGLPHTITAVTVNQVCGSGLRAAMNADNNIRLGEAPSHGPSCRRCGRIGATVEPGSSTYRNR